VRIRPDVFPAQTLALAPSNSNILYAGTSGSGVFRSTDSGDTWSEINEGLTSLDVRVLAVDPSNPNVVYAGTSGGGVFSIHLRFSPKITNASIQGKNLVVVGENFLARAVLIMNGKDQKTKPDGQNPNALIGKKTGKKIARGQTVTLQVRNSDGTLSNEFSFMRPFQ
jgi:hypothetical protein